MPANIYGQERSLEKVFSDDYSFVVPLYQRPYSVVSRLLCKRFSSR